MSRRTRGLDTMLCGTSDSAMLWYLLRHVAAGFCYVIAGAALVLAVLLAGITDDATMVVCWLFGTVVAAAALGTVCVPDLWPRRPSADVRARVEPVGVYRDPAETRPVGWDDDARALKRLFDAPARRPPHDYPLRPSRPPEGGDHG
ncbi:hypothetical protein HH310_12375 [Actinoplanes sp. TBRC 11911]|uniref:hypothetical protein n=1 Tax=Actinoplanes sp. TBRC 11911 TaxID=2729386 RepID=UPI00145DBAF1|nr:hypothetical protein [Actinoplanes sp. TBRC 11911]NMO51989.1 hypothetical protein [Actinoplanes sp. TBRC 11911]